MSKREDITDQIYGRLLALVTDWYKTKETGKTHWFCQCEDNNIVSVQLGSLRNGNTQSCGCLNREKASKRISDKNNPNYKEKITIICRYCGEEKKVIPSLKETQFCNKECHNQWMSENRVGKNHPNYKEKVIIICKWCGKERKVWPCLKDIVQFCDIKCMGKWYSENLKKGNNPAWKNGITPLSDSIRNSLKAKEFVQKILKKANYTCLLSQKIGGELQVHHIKGFAKILEENNITTEEEAFECKELWDEKNVVVLSEKWHTGIKTDNPNAFHRLYGTMNFTEEDFYEWFNKYKVKGNKLFDNFKK